MSSTPEDDIIHTGKTIEDSREKTLKDYRDD
ncbi:unnamed protein product, partial [marine sediment metagenome]